LTILFLSLIRRTALWHCDLHAAVRASRRLLRGPLSQESGASEHCDHRGRRCKTDQAQFHNLGI
jgi:hypothetical protein